MSTIAKHGLGGLVGECPQASGRVAAQPLEADLPSASIIVPTYQEASNLPELLRRLEETRVAAKVDLEVLIVDDDSRDGTSEVVAAFGRPWVHLYVRTGRRGLSSAVCEGLEHASKEVVVVMDADLSHPPETIAVLLAKLAEGADFVLGSRYVAGGTTDDNWGFFRWANSQIATALARPLTHARDPMSGFFALWRQSLASRTLDPVGYKIGLELIVKCDVRRLVEVPIHFSDRVRGDSKLNLLQQLLYVKHLRRLYRHKYGSWTDFFQFAIVGASGVVINLLTMRLLLFLHFAKSSAVAGGIATSMVTNFLLNRRFSFAGAHVLGIGRQFVIFCASSAVGALVNYGVTLEASRALAAWPLEVASLLGISAGLGFNFVACRFWVFRRRHYREARGGDGCRQGQPTADGSISGAAAARSAHREP